MPGAFHVEAIHMASWMRRLATLVGTSVFFGGIVLLALGVPTRSGTIGWELLLGPAVPWWLFLISYTVGPLLLVAGAVGGMRYGNFERFHRDYDEETGTIDSDHPIAALHARVTSDRLEPEDPPEKFVFTRTHLVATIAGVTLPFLGYLYVSGLDGWFLQVIGATLVVAGLLSIVVTDYVLRNNDEYEYGT